jgi:hypothetical protein
MDLSSGEQLLGPVADGLPGLGGQRDHVVAAHVAVRDLVVRLLLGEPVPAA